MEDRLNEFLELVRRYDEANGTDPVPNQVKKACNISEPLMGFLNSVIIQCDKEMSIVNLCRKVARERNARTVLRFAPETQLVCRSNARTRTGTRTMLPSTNQDEHWRTTFSNFTCHPFAIRNAGFVLSRFTVRPDGRNEPIFALIPEKCKWISGCWW